MNWLKENWFKVLAGIIGTLVIIFLLLNIFNVRLNINYFNKCPEGNRFNRFSNLLCERRLFIPQRP